MIRLAYLDYRATMKERKTWIAGAMLLYAVVAIPVVLERPPEHVRETIAAWFGNPDPFVVFMFIWIDLAMNKSIAFIPIVLGSGILLRERDTGVLAVLGAKPLSMSRYFVIRASSACAAMFTLYALAQLLGALWFSVKIPGFRPGTFLAAMSLHALGGVWATALTATIAVAVRRRIVAALVSIAVLGLLVGLALVGYYQPAWQTLTLANPISLAALAMGKLGALDVSVLAPPMLALIVLTAVTMALGARFARNVEA
jgi:ABC-2 type transport system permease protein